ncbi:MAG TPA: ribose-5-phosphate isomerase [Mycobacteriales bacterium]|nr:ribose-5-phosphate isomerase [Mycobacteriales bacterium]
MEIFVGTDHAGYRLKEDLVPWLRATGHDVVDCGATSYDESDDYPGFVISATERALARPGAMAVVLGGSGNGEAIAANKVVGARAALCWSAQTAVLAREHNDANVCSLPARFLDLATARAVVTAFVTTPFSAAARHTRRLAEIAAYESAGRAPR